MSETTKRIALSKLTAWSKNYRRGDIPSIMLSIKTLGFNNVLGVHGGVVYAGNQRLAALKELHRDDPTNPPAGITRRGNDWMVACVELDHLTEAERTAYAIADNRTHDRGKENEAQLAALLGDLASDPALELATGYTESDIMDLLDSLRGETPKGIEDPNQGILDHEPGIVKCPACGEDFKP